MSKYAVLDFETTGLISKESEVTEVAVALVDDKYNVTGVFNTFININGDVPERITELTGITKEDCDRGLPLDEVKKVLRVILDDRILVCQNAPFDISFLRQHFGYEPERFVCTRTLTAFAQPFESASLSPTCKRLGIKLNVAHRAMNDVNATLEVLKYWSSKGVYIENTITSSSDRELLDFPKSTIHIFNQDKRRDIMSNADYLGGVSR